MAPVTANMSRLEFPTTEAVMPTWTKDRAQQTRKIVCGFVHTHTHRHNRSRSQLELHYIFSKLVLFLINSNLEALR